MKAKEYAEKYLKSDTKETEIVEIAKSFLIEIETLSKSRNAKFDRALVHICKELNQKWITFATLVNKNLPVTEQITYNGFNELVKRMSPELHILWSSSL